MLDFLGADLSLIGRLLLAGLLGGLIGLERDVHGRAAGLRTHLLVSLGSAVFMVLSALVARSGAGGTVQTDPGRIAAQVVTGIGFLGAGVILKDGANVRGLTTAACLWVAAAIGMAAGAGREAIAIAATAIALICLIVLKAFERLYAKDSYRTLIVTTALAVEAGQVIALVKRSGVTVLTCDIMRDYTRGTTRTTLGLRLFHRGVTDKLAHGIIASLEQADLEVRQVRWTGS